jgi:hypothetical protein
MSPRGSERSVVQYWKMSLEESELLKEVKLPGDEALLLLHLILELQHLSLQLFFGILEALHLESLPLKLVSFFSPKTGNPKTLNLAF